MEDGNEVGGLPTDVRREPLYGDRTSKRKERCQDNGEDRCTIAVSVRGDRSTDEVIEGARE